MPQLAFAFLPGTNSPARGDELAPHISAGGCARGILKKLWRKPVVLPGPDQMRNLVLFLGAGFSWDAALPVMSRFGEYAKLKHFRLAELEREMVPELVEAANTYELFRRGLLDRRALSGSGADNIENVFCVAEALREAGVESMPIGNKVVDLATIVARIRTWIWKVYHQLPFYNSQRSEARLETYRDFVTLLSESGVANRATVLTTNYDIVFEWAAHLGGLRTAYPLDNAEECAVGTGPERFVVVGPGRDEAIPVLKLHGSINYFERDNEARPLMIANNISDGSEIAGRRFTPDIPAVVAVDALADIRSDCGSESALPAIIPPGYAKIVSSGWLRETWSVAFEALQSAKAILFIGYSMPPSDGLLSSVFAGSLGVRGGSIGQPTVFVIDPDPEVPTRLSRVFPGRVRKSEPKGLREAISTELPLVLKEMAAD